MNKYITTSILAYFLLAASPVNASGTSAGGNPCQPIYGGGQTCVTENLLLDKKVQNPKTNSFVDSLGVNDPKYQPATHVTFQLIVKNTGDATLEKTIVKDTFPQYVDFASAPGKFDSKTHTLTFEVNDLKKGESRTFTLVGRIVAAANLPTNQGVTCVVNQASATSNNKMSQDNAQFCIQKDVLAAKIPTETKGGLKVFEKPEVKTTPPTGPEMITLIGLIPAGLSGLMLRRKTKLA